MIRKASTLRECFRILRLDSSNFNNQFNDFHVNRNYCYPLDALLMRIKLLADHDVSNPPSGELYARILFTGQTGVGKTTELYFIKKHLEKTFNVFFINSLVDGLNYSNFQYTDILLVFLKKLIYYVEEHKIIVDKNLLNELNILLCNLITSYSDKTIKKNIQDLSIGELFGVIEEQILYKTKSREIFITSTKNLANKFIDSFNKLVNFLEKETDKKIMVIVDDLEKITNQDGIKEFVDDNKKFFTNLKCNVILTIPPTIKYSDDFKTIRATFVDELFLPLFETFTVEGKINTTELSDMCKIIENRICPNLFDEKAIKLAAIYSGGIVNDMLLICSNACIHALSNNVELVDTKSIRSSFEDMRGDFKDSVLVDIPAFDSIHMTKTLSLTSDNLKKMFVNAILAYKNIQNVQDTWYDIHPALWSLAEIEKIKSDVENGKF